MDLDEQTKNEAAKWRTMQAALRADVERYERQRIEWLTSTGSDTRGREEAMNRSARHVVGYLALLFGVAP